MVLQWGVSGSMLQDLLMLSVKEILFFISPSPHTVSNLSVEILLKKQTCLKEYNSVAQHALKFNQKST